MAMRRFSLNAKIVSLATLAAVLLCVGAVVVDDAYDDVVESSRLTEHSYQVLLIIGTIESRVIDLETGQRGYLLTGDEQYLKPYLEANAVLDKVFDALSGSTVDNAKQQAGVITLRRLIGAKRALTDRTILLRRAQRAQAAMEIIGAGEGKRLSDQIRAVLLVMEREERRLLNERREVEQQNLKEYQWISVYGGLLIILSLSAVVILIRDDLLMRAKLKAAVRGLDEEKTKTLTVVQRFIKDQDTTRISTDQKPNPKNS